MLSSIEAPDKYVRDGAVFLKHLGTIVLKYLKVYF